MKISDILLESPDNIKLLLMLENVYLQKLEDAVSRVKKQFLENPSPINADGMRSFLSYTNQQLELASSLPQWDEWMKYPDGQAVMQEMTVLFNSNTQFMLKYR